MSIEERNQDIQKANDFVFRNMRNKIMHGEYDPGHVFTLRGVAEQFGVSMTPAREAVRRLGAEGALHFSQSGRISTHRLTPERIEELVALRAMLEPELAARAMPRVHSALLDRLYLINVTSQERVVKGDVSGYIRSNLEFHRTLYLRAQSPATLAIAETIWLQLGPTMRFLYEKRKHRQASEFHMKIIGSLKAGDEPGLRLAMRIDVTAGLKLLLS